MAREDNPVTKAVVSLMDAGVDIEKFDWESVSTMREYTNEPLSTLVCIGCGWRGVEPDLKEIPWTPEDDLPVAGETERVCPRCERPYWEPV